MQARVAGHGQSEAGAVSNDPGPMVADRPEPEAETRHEITASLADGAEVSAGEAEPKAIDVLEAAIAAAPQIPMPLVHSFTPGIYCRQILMPGGTALTSRVHKTEHHFVVLTGCVMVKSDTEEVTYRAPYLGITKPGTRRALVALEDTIWMTIHSNPDNETDPDVIAERISDMPDNPLIPDKDHPSVNAWKTSVSPSIVYVSDSLKLIESR